MIILQNREDTDPYLAYRLKVEKERKDRNLSKKDITLTEVNWKLEEIKQRYKNCGSLAKRHYECSDKHLNDAKSIAGNIQKVQKVTHKQWNKLIAISFMLFEIPHPEGLHYCGRR